jgi:sortase (surface protein transpeptidase)
MPEDVTEQERQKIIEDLTSDAAPKAEAKDSSREYVVWRKQAQASPSAAQAWEFVSKVDATSNEQAVRKAAENIEDDNPVSFVAIPSRSFQPIVVEKKTTKTLILT